MEDDVLAEARSFFNLVREASNQGDVDLVLAKILAAGSKHISLVNAHLAKNGVRPGWDGHLFRFGEVLGWRREVKGWQDAADEVVALGLDPEIVSLKYWQQHIELPHVFVNCAGCRHESVARKDRPRFCSLECQRAHWVAGHMHACPCAHTDG